MLDVYCDRPTRRRTEGNLLALQSRYMVQYISPFRCTRRNYHSKTPYLCSVIVIHYTTLHCTALHNLAETLASEILSIPSTRCRHFCVGVQNAQRSITRGVALRPGWPGSPVLDANAGSPLAKQPERVPGTQRLLTHGQIGSTGLPC